MHKFTQSKSWDEVLKLISQLITENKQLKAEKQQLVNELMNLRLKINQEEKRKKQFDKMLISEMHERCCYK